MIILVLITLSIIYTVKADFATFGGISGCSCQTPYETGPQSVSCETTDCIQNFRVPYDALTGYLMNISYNVTFWKNSPANNLFQGATATSFLDHDGVKNGNERRVNFSNVPSAGSGIVYFYYTHINQSFTPTMFSNSNCGSWPNVCTWYPLLNVTASFASTGRNRQINYTANWLNYTWNYTADTFAPNISLINPYTGAWSKTGENNFTYNVSDDKDILNCSLMINNARNATKFPIQKIPEIQNFSQNFSDGFYNWTVNCTDNTSYRNTGNASRYVLKVDLTPPNVSLESPANNSVWTIDSDVLFKYNATDNLGNITCNLIVDSSYYALQENVTKGVPGQNFTAIGVQNGYHNWTFNCSDEAGNYYFASWFNLSVNYAGASVTVTPPVYELGETVTISGVNWQSNANITINITKPNGIKFNLSAVANDTGSFNLTYFLNYSEPYGQFNLTALNKQTPGQNSSTNFNVNQRFVYVSTNNTIIEGQTIWINGSGVSPNSTVIINITNPSSFTSNITTTSNATGHFNATFPILFTGPPGLWSITAWDYYFMNLNATTTFTVNDRVANVSTNLTTYLQNALVVINGSWYYPLDTVNIIIKNRDNLATKTFSNDSDALGDIGTFWNTTDACNGNYSVIAQQGAYSLEAEANFTIDSGLFNYQLTALPYQIGQFNWTGVQTVATDLWRVNVSDNTYQNVTNINSPAGGQYYIELNWTTSIPSSATMQNITFINEMYVTQTNRIEDYSVNWFNGTGFQQICYTAQVQSTSDTDFFCELTDYIQTGADAGEIRLQLNYTKTSPQTQPDVYIDFARLSINYTSPKPCTPWINYPPEIDISNFFLDDSVEQMPREIDLLAGTTTKVYCNASVRDDNGWADVSGANATMYLDGFQGGALDNSTKYFNSSCSCTYQNWQYAECVCAFDVWHYANNGTWYCNMTVWDSKSNVTNNITNATIRDNTFLSITLDDGVLDFGNIAPGENSTSSKLANITNTGNRPINISVYAYANESGDNMSMMCENGVSWINTSYLRYNLTDQNWTGMFEVNKSLTPIDGLTIPKRTGSEEKMNSTYWRLMIPPATIGVCNGSLVFSASMG